ncbi:hypothetical protein BDN72DRAFT_858751 [Pluteus cervinus]|uniref:Uncharacterized protein n=1 Tax=Pluteus cervinus TaxID=181527 RepID=A0ACD3AQL3_9AGAR|nr:hypothetical protein BDN72DRAFT_858751 [Pluteus cervinus]
MSPFTRLFSLLVLGTIAAGTGGIVPPGLSSAGADPESSTLNPVDVTTANPTDIDTIISTIRQVNQKTGAEDKSPPSPGVPETVVTAVDGNVTIAGQNSSSLLGVLHDTSAHPEVTTGSIIGSSSVSSPSRKRMLDGYTTVFEGTGTGPNDRDASIQGTAYLTYKVLDNSTYDVDGCQDFCNSVPACVFCNLYYEFNARLNVYWHSNDDYLPSNLKCALYADYHTAAEKTNWGGQKLEPSSPGLTYIQQSSGYSRDPLVASPLPDGYQQVFGPLNASTDAPGVRIKRMLVRADLTIACRTSFMGFALLDKYDVKACANLCNSRPANPVGGACQFFNIWRAVQDGNPKSYTCTMFYLSTDASTATSTGQDGVSVTYSRGYQRISILPDGGFEGTGPCPYFYSGCHILSTTYWAGTSANSNDLDASILRNELVQYARTGFATGQLGAVNGDNSNPGTLSIRNPLNSVPGKQYVITFFQDSSYSGPEKQAAAFVNVLWNGNTVLSLSGYSTWQYNQVTVTAQGNDILAFYGGAAPAWTDIDDVYVFLA